MCYQTCENMGGVIGLIAHLHSSQGLLWCVMYIAEKPFGGGGGEREREYYGRMGQQKVTTSCVLFAGNSKIPANRKCGKILLIVQLNTRPRHHQNFHITQLGP